jgi:DNA-binding transcriptional MerR regulator
VAENFRTEQNRELLEKLAEETGGRYYTPETVAQLNEEVAYSEAGITTREIRDLWDMPAVFLLLILLRAAEWLLRRRWGGV